MQAPKEQCPALPQGTHSELKTVQARGGAGSMFPSSWCAWSSAEPVSQGRTCQHGITCSSRAPHGAALPCSAILLAPARQGAPQHGQHGQGKAGAGNGTTRCCRAGSCVGMMMGQERSCGARWLLCFLCLLGQVFPGTAQHSQHGQTGMLGQWS